jgi:hypothetical protein
MAMLELQAVGVSPDKMSLCRIVIDSILANEVEARDGLFMEAMGHPEVLLDGLAINQDFYGEHAYHVQGLPVSPMAGSRWRG